MREKYQIPVRQGGFTRREFLSICAIMGIQASHPAIASPYSQIAPPTNLKLNGKAVISPGDISYLGRFRVPDDPLDQNGSRTRFGWSGGHISGRYVNRDLRLFLLGSLANTDGISSPQPLYEISYPGQSLTFATAPVASVIHNWGDIYQGKRATANGGDCNVRGIHWDGTYLWWAYGDGYNTAGYWDPSVGCTKLNYDRSINTYGPWRTTVHSQQTRGYFVGIPASFSSQFCPGRSIAVGAPITSGNVRSPWGPALFALSAIDPSTTPANALADTNKSLNVKTLILNDYSHPAPRCTHYYSEGWQDYPTNTQPFRNAGVPYFGGNSGDALGSGLDVMSAAVWIDLPTKHGVLFFGQMVHKSDDNAPYASVWYGPSTGPYGETAVAWEATGPGTNAYTPFYWIYDPATLGSIALGAAPPHSAKPSAVVNMYSIYGGYCGFYFQGGAWFDPISSLLFIGTRNEDAATNWREPRPVIHVFKIKS